MFLPRPVTFFSLPLLSLGMEKLAPPPPGGAGLEVEVAGSTQLSKTSGGDRRGGCEAPRKGRELYSDCSKPRRRFPFRALARVGPL